MVSVAFIGAGYMTTEHAKAFANIDNVVLCGIFSRTRSKAEALAATYPDMICCDSIASLYESCQPDLVVIAVPELSVRVVCEEAFQFPWTCLVEKPVGYDYDDAEAICHTAEKHNTRVYVGLNRRHYSSTKNVLAEMAETDGKRLIHVYDQENPKAALAAGQPEKVVENWMYANSIHVVDYFNFMGRGQIISIENLISYDPSTPLFVLSKLAYDSGDIGIYECVWNAPGPWSVVINTQSKRWEMRPVEQATCQLYGSRKQEPLPIHEWDSQFKPGLRLQAQECVNAVMGLEHNLPSIKDAFISMKLIKAIYFGNN
jgi:predicted dehydrogenase